MKNFALAVLKGLNRDLESVKALDSVEVGITCEAPNVLERDEFAQDLQNVLDNISGVRHDRGLLSASRNVEAGSASLVDVNRTRPQGHACCPNEMGGRH